MAEVLLCETFGCLPKSGGLYDQDVRWVREAMIVLNARAAMREAREKIAALKQTKRRAA